ncbi:hypothetical protein Sez_0502 [Streptococcus equi subsp. zooepidemicus MGCS10565]|uniref:Uncharacterized protein n=1 Tax=Streptococcus equi subsp. zooepidemicus (strain MGCS10565) TaxID=552526 RepID=B4U1K7_STREM|nr:hypothetical protein Sez_0502 [Streptococcus equi subsp. zooepidemicus MGCS10565]
MSDIVTHQQGLYKARKALLLGLIRLMVFITHELYAKAWRLVND